MEDERPTSNPTSRGVEIASAIARVGNLVGCLSFPELGVSVSAA